MSHSTGSRRIVERRAAQLGFELLPESRWMQRDNGRYYMRWRLQMIGSEIARNTSFFRTLAEVDQRLDIEAARKGEL